MTINILSKRSYPSGSPFALPLPLPLPMVVPLPLPLPLPLPPRGFGGQGVWWCGGKGLLWRGDPTSNTSDVTNVKSTETNHDNNDSESDTSDEDDTIDVFDIEVARAAHARATKARIQAGQAACMQLREAELRTADEVQEQQEWVAVVQEEGRSRRRLEFTVWEGRVRVPEPP